MGMGPHVLPPLDAVGVDGRLVRVRVRVRVGVGLGLGLGLGGADGRLVASVVAVAQVERLEHAGVDAHQPLGRAGAGVEVFRLGLALGFG